MQRMNTSHLGCFWRVIIQCINNSGRTWTFVLPKSFVLSRHWSSTSSQPPLKYEGRMFRNGGTILSRNAKGIATHVNYGQSDRSPSNRVMVLPYLRISSYFSCKTDDVPNVLDERLWFLACLSRLLCSICLKLY